MTAAARSWKQTYALRIAMLDAIALLWGFAGALVLTALGGRQAVTSENHQVLYPLAICMGWFFLLSAVGSRSWTVFGNGIDEYRRVVYSGLLFFGMSSTLAVAFNLDLSFLFLLYALALTTTFLLIERWVMRNWLVSRRTNEGLYCANVLVYGNADRIADVVHQLAHARGNGYNVIGLAVPPGQASPNSEGFTGDVTSDPISAMRERGADTLVLAGGGGNSPDFVREIGWKLNPRSESLLLAEALIDVAGPRIEAKYVPNLSLIGVSSPTYGGASRFAKRLTDITIAGVALVIVSPVFLILALIIKLGSPGPVFFNQVRVGYGGRLFKMHKFRSMVVDAEEIRASLLDDPSRNTNDVLFKMKDDPRVTTVGRFMRRYSIDELPQFWNVISGEMSVVGPRPPLPEEVLKYEDKVKRRFLVRPGITGLWQISGRSDLDWRQSVRLDLYYVENWSLLQDLHIIWRTFRVVFTGKGAY